MAGKSGAKRKYIESILKTCIIIHTYRQLLDMKEKVHGLLEMAQLCARFLCPVHQIFVAPRVELHKIKQIN